MVAYQYVKQEMQHSSEDLRSAGAFFILPVIFIRRIWVMGGRGKNENKQSPAKTGGPTITS